MLAKLIASPSQGEKYLEAGEANTMTPSQRQYKQDTLIHEPTHHVESREVVFSGSDVGFKAKCHVMILLSMSL